MVFWALRDPELFTQKIWKILSSFTHSQVVQKLHWTQKKIFFVVFPDNLLTPMSFKIFMSFFSRKEIMFFEENISGFFSI